MSPQDASSPPSPPPRRQTTVLIGGSNGTASLISILGDRSNPANRGHVVRVVTRNPSRFLVRGGGGGEDGDGDGDEGGEILRWRCHEQKPLSDVVPNSLLPTRWVTHVGGPDSVYGYDDAEAVGLPPSAPGGARSRAEYSGLERAISGLGSPDDGGAADVLLLCCPVSAHLPLLRRIVRALHRLEADGVLGGGSGGGSSGGAGGGRKRPRAPLFIGSLYGAGGFDWMARIAFASEKPRPPLPAFSGTFSRPLALFGLKAFPYLCKSTKPGTVTMYGRYPQLLCALAPADPATRVHATVLLERILQSRDTGKRIHFLGLSADPVFGGDGSGSAAMAGEAGYGFGAGYGGGGRGNVATAAAVAAAAAAAGSRKDGGKASAASSLSSLPPPPPPHLAGAVAPVLLPPVGSLPVPLADRSDPNSSLAFLSCTLNATNQILHPCILAALFHDPRDPGASDADGTIPWDPSAEGTPLPRFYADGAAKPEAGRMLVAMAAEEFYPVIDALEALLVPPGRTGTANLGPISRLHGGEPVGRIMLNSVGNDPRSLGSRSGLTELAIRTQLRGEAGAGGDDDSDDGGDGDGGAGGDGSSSDRGGDDGKKSGHSGRSIRLRRLFEWSMSYGLSRNSRLSYVLSPALPVPNADPADTAVRRVRPNTDTRFFQDDVPHGLCLVLGLALLLGFDLERDMPQTLACVRRLQRWMGKEYVLTAEDGGRKVRRRRDVLEAARDVGETSAPQAFGVRSVPDLRRFLGMSLFGEEPQRSMEDRVQGSAMAARIVPGGRL